MRVVFICDGWIGLNVQFEMMTLTVNMFALQTNTLQVNEIANLKVEGQKKTQSLRALSRILCSTRSVRPDHTQQRPAILRQICAYPSCSQQPTQTLTRLLLHAQSRWSLPCNQIHPSSTDWQFDLWHLVLSSNLGHREKRNHSITTFHSTAVVLEWRRRAV